MLIDWFTTIAQVINFLILVWLLKRFLYKPILHAIDEREKKISKKLSNAEMIQTDAKKESDELKNKIKDIDDQRASLLNKAKEDAQAERKSLLEEARKAAEAFTEKRREEFKRDEKQVHQSVIQKTQKEVFAITRKVLMDLSGRTLESQIVDVFICRLNDLSEEKKNLVTAAFSSSTGRGIIRSSVELSAKQRTAIESSIRECINSKFALQFEIVPDLLGGIEFIVNGQKLAWSIDNYLTSLEKEVHNLLIPGERVP
jgi:F-type H+-transporting ATPase subunit b